MSLDGNKVAWGMFLFVPPAIVGILLYNLSTMIPTIDRESRMI